MPEQDERSRKTGRPDPQAKMQGERTPMVESWSRKTPAPTKIKAEHTVAKGETLSHIALKYYGSAVKEKWMIIYEANKAVIGDNPNLIRAGQVLKIPELE